jgi:hypothetical protein
MPIVHCESDSTFFVTIGDVDYTVKINPKDGQPLVTRHDDTGQRAIIPRPELGALLAELITQHLQQQASAWSRLGALYRVPAVEI